jgi:hypothetical protein
MEHMTILTDQLSSALTELADNFLEGLGILPSTSFDFDPYLTSPRQLPSYPGAFPNEPDGLAPYVYQPLFAGLWIQVLRLEPGRVDDPIKCSLHSVQLSNRATQYDALSYV